MCAVVWSRAPRATPHRVLTVCVCTALHFGRPFRGKECVDGSIRLWGAQRQRLVPPGATLAADRVRISSGDCARMRDRYTSPSDFLRISSVEAVRDMMLWGEDHVEEMDAAGGLAPLDAFRL